jgi:hypothetical protein
VTPDEFPYTTAQAFGAALTDRLGSLAVTSGRSVTQLRRQFAYDRLLARLFADDPRGWIVKGGVSLVVRLGSARYTADVDLVGPAGSPEDALTALRRAVTRDLGDFFTFRLSEPRALVQGVAGLRVAAEARLGPRSFERFGVDVVTGVEITGSPEEFDPALPLRIPGLVKPRYRLYPLVDSIADKVTAMAESHHGRPSTRFRDLADLVLIARAAAVSADGMARALASERLRRGLPQVTALVVPDNATWRSGYRAIARDLPGLTERSFDEALVLARRFVDPVLGGAAAGRTWDPAALTWR